MAIIRDASGLFAICGICRNSLRSIDPDPSLWRACMHHAKDAREGEETYHRACESFLGQRVRGASGQAPVQLHEALLQPLQFAGVDCTHIHT